MLCCCSAKKLLFDPSELTFPPMTSKFLRDDWSGLFSAQVFHLMPTEALRESFHETLGCPTKELLRYGWGDVLKEFFDLMIEQAVKRCPMVANQGCQNITKTKAKQEP